MALDTDLTLKTLDKHVREVIKAATWGETFGCMRKWKSERHWNEIYMRM